MTTTLAALVEALEGLLGQVTLFCEQHGEADFETDQAAAALALARAEQAEPVAEVASATEHQAIVKWLGEPKPHGTKLYTTPPAPVQAVEPQWQPIETAPRDSSSIIIYSPKSTRKPVCEAWWAIAYEGDQGGHWQTPIGPNGRGYTILADAPTHWMPLPAPPAHGIAAAPPLPKGGVFDPAQFTEDQSGKAVQKCLT